MYLRKFSDTSEDPLHSPDSKYSLDRRTENLYRETRTLVDPFYLMLMKIRTILASLNGVASLPKRQAFPPKISPAQLLAGADARVNSIQNELFENELTRPGRFVL
jgi:hypothetical protein